LIVGVVVDGFRIDNETVHVEDDGLVGWLGHCAHFLCFDSYWYLEVGLFMNSCFGNRR
jgi:hypothetical protein